MAAFEEIAAMIKAVENAKPERRVDCPECGETLRTHQKTQQLHCPFCGWVEGIIIKGGR